MSTINISVEGAQTSSADWDAAQDLPCEQVPPLTPEQRETAKQLGVPEEDYARSALARSKGIEKAVLKTERFARLLQQKLKALKPEAEIESVRLDGRHDRFEVEMKLDGRQAPFVVSEKLVDELFESGSPEAERRLQRVLELAVGVEPG